MDDLRVSHDNLKARGTGSYESEFVFVSQQIDIEAADRLLAELVLDDRKLHVVLRGPADGVYGTLFIHLFIAV